MSERNAADNLRSLLQQCTGFEGDSEASDRETATDYYFMRPRGDEVVGRSDVVSGDLSAMVEATLAQMVEAFGSEQLFEFDPYGPEDEDQAKLEADAVQYFLNKENTTIELMNAIKEILLYRNGVVCVDAVDRTIRRVKTLTNVEIEAIGELAAGDDVVSEDYDPETKDLTLTLETRTRELKIDSVSLENFVYHANWTKPTLEGIPVCAVRHISTRAELIAMGMPKAKVRKLGLYSESVKSESAARETHGHSETKVAIDSSQERVEWYDVFVRRETDGGIDELRRVRFSYQDRVILEDDPAPFINLAAGIALINPHRFKGISLYDKLKQTQDIRTGLRRALHDNVNATTKHRLAGLDEVVNSDDAADPRVNNMVRVKPTVQDVRAAVMPLAVPDTSANILANLESTGRERSEMGGAALDLQTSQVQIGGDRMGSQGLDRAYSVSEQLTALMMKTIAITIIRSVALLVHQTLREYFDEPVPIKRNGKWQYPKPSQWPERGNVTVKPGMSPGERMRRIESLDNVIDRQLMLAREGMDEVLIDITGFYRACMDRDRLAGVQNPEQYYIDPESDRSQMAVANKEKQREQEQMQRAALMQTSLGLENLRIGFEKYRQDSDLLFKYFAETLGVEVEEAKIAAQAAMQLMKGEGVEQETGRKESEGERTPEGDTGAAES